MCEIQLSRWKALCSLIPVQRRVPRCSSCRSMRTRVARTVVLSSYREEQRTLKCAYARRYGVQYDQFRFASETRVASSRNQLRRWALAG